MGVALVIIMMGVVGAYWVWPKLERAGETVDRIISEELGDRGSVDETLIVAVAGSSLLAALLVAIAAISFR